jgi:hypothetical protein
MLKYFLLHKYTLITLVAVVTMAIYMAGYHTTALVAGSLTLSFVLARETFKANVLSVAYESGVFIGIASFFWIWSLIAFPVYVILMYGPLKVTHFRMFWALCLGLVTPLWCYSPYWIFNNTDYLTDLMLRLQERFL